METEIRCVGTVFTRWGSKLSASDFNSKEGSTNVEPRRDHEKVPNQTSTQHPPRCGRTPTFLSSHNDGRAVVWVGFSFVLGVWTHSMTDPPRGFHDLRVRISHPGSFDSTFFLFLLPVPRQPVPKDNRRKKNGDDKCHKPIQNEFRKSLLTIGGFYFILYFPLFYFRTFSTGPYGIFLASLSWFQIPWSLRIRSSLPVTKCLMI